MSKLGEKAKVVGSIVGDAARMGSYLHSFADIFAAMMGKDSIGSASAAAKGLHGFFGLADERTFLRLMRLIGRENKKHIIGFLRWQFPSGTTEEWLVSTYYGNQFRNLIVKMAEKDALSFLGTMVQTIKNAGGGKRGFRAVRAELLTQNAPLPPENATQALRDAREWFAGLPSEVRRLFEELHVYVNENLKEAVVRVEAEVAHRNSRPKDFLDRLIKWF